MFGIALIVVCVAAYTDAACEYTIQNFKVSQCDSKPTPFELKDPNVAFSDDCNLKLMGCVTLTKSVKTLSVDYVAKKDGLQVIKGKQKACNEELWGTKIDCPWPAGKKMCTTEKWIYKVPGGKSSLAMAMGSIVAEATVKTDLGNYCYKVTATVKKGKK